MDRSSKILVTGGRGLVGMATLRALEIRGYSHIYAPTSEELDLTDWESTKSYFLEHEPSYVIHCAARVYGIMGNLDNKGKSYLDNILINTHVIEASRLVGVKKITAMGTGCVYPYPSPRLPLHEDDIWNGYPHHSEDSYAIAKRAMLAQLTAYNESYNIDYAFVISGNLYGPHDKFDEEYGHVTPALISKFFRAMQKGGKISVWGDGSALRDFMFSYDAGEAIVLVAENHTGAINMASGEIASIADIVEMLGRLSGLSDQVVWDSSKPNGQDYRAYDLAKLRSLGYQPKYSLSDGLAATWKWYTENQSIIRR